MTIEYLADHPHFIPTLAEWFFAEWHEYSENASVERETKMLESSLQKRAIPTTLIAVEDGVLQGTAGLFWTDVIDEPDLSPWMASVYVAEEFRGRGIATALVQRLYEEAKAIGVKKMYLFTPDQERLYGRIGWTVLKRRPHQCGHEVVVMELAIE